MQRVLPHLKQGPQNVCDGGVEKVPRKLNLKIKLAKHDNFDFADIWPVACFFSRIEISYR